MQALSKLEPGLKMSHHEFTKMVCFQGCEFYRSMPWREDTRPYYVLVSEMMLQQTQVSRVIPKFEAFIERFPDEAALADASLADVLKLWQGLGYNRRAKFLHEAVKIIVNDFSGVFPQKETDILKLPGVGKNTAGAIRAYAFNQPSIFVETNIRTVYIHHFFRNRHEIEDKQVIALLEQTIDKSNPRRFYQNLMDYGAWLKANGVQNISQSKHYKKQSKLEGSLRQMRGNILSVLSGDQRREDALEVLRQDPRYELAVKSLCRDGLIVATNDTIDLTK